MNTPAPMALATRLAPLLNGLDWGVGGSTLLYHLGLEANPQDLDLLVTPEHFAQAHLRLAELFNEEPRPAHPRHIAQHFARFVSQDGSAIDLIAGICVRDGEKQTSWDFDPAQVDIEHGLPWMRAEDWLTLYTLFQRPFRVQQLQNWLNARDAEQRCGELEIRLAFLDDTVDALSSTLARQQHELDLLQEQLRLLYRQSARGSGENEERSLRDEIPPHY
ncbi:SlyX family protein [Craterilacuibacter sp. RT1T]|uniref:SlyX family protein n=1 Tax=Craterilacuibacter sp. RT1T TaxID=2942211 RepID=UPI0020C07431|nr:SlyX family protein [Craterilacuibacter sp. RT1T]MCL6264440.1 SlyX family protein [Craterilacuibacter sp. RT1T]